MHLNKNIKRIDFNNSTFRENSVDTASNGGRKRLQGSSVSLSREPSGEIKTTRTSDLGSMASEDIEQVQPDGDETIN